jgi:hypothetical protein
VSFWNLVLWILRHWKFRNIPPPFSPILLFHMRMRLRISNWAVHCYELPQGISSCSEDETCYGSINKISLDTAPRWLLLLLHTAAFSFGLNKQRKQQTASSWYAPARLPEAASLLCMPSCISDSNTKISYDSLQTFITSLTSFASIYILNYIGWNAK